MENYEIKKLERKIDRLEENIDDLKKEISNMQSEERQEKTKRSIFWFRVCGLIVLPILIILNSIYS